MGSLAAAESDVAMIWRPKYSREEIVERAKSLIGREAARSANDWLAQNKITCLDMVCFVYGWPETPPRIWKRRDALIDEIIRATGWQWVTRQPIAGDLLVFDVKGPHLGIYAGDGAFIHCGSVRVTRASLQRYERYKRGVLSWVF